MRTQQTTPSFLTILCSKGSGLAPESVSEACFSTTYAPYGSTTVCPNGAEFQIGTGAGILFKGSGFYVNDYFDQTQEQVNRTYRENFPRLLEIKKQYDPTNLFRLNANIKST